MHSIAQRTLIAGRVSALTVHSIRCAELLEFLLHGRIWTHVGGLHPATGACVSNVSHYQQPSANPLIAGRDGCMHLICFMTGMASLEKRPSPGQCHAMMERESGSEIPEGHAGRERAPALYSVYGSLHEFCEGSLVQEGLLYVIFAQILHHIDPTRFQYLPEYLQHA